MVCCSQKQVLDFSFHPNLKKEIRPWGFFITHYTPTDKSVCFKTLVIECGYQLSLQYHNHRSEFWYIHDENSSYKLTLGERVDIFRGERTIQIPCKTPHTIMNMSSIPLIIYEMQYASGENGRCEDSDIIRLYDPYADSR